MKNLNEYETPITDDLEYHTGQGVYVVNSVRSRDLERKLAMCRDALSEIAAFRTMKSNDAGAVISEDAKDIATEALDQTKLKSSPNYNPKKSASSQRRLAGGSAE